MKTRSQTKCEQYDVIIDFDGASEAWKANKKSIGNGSYTYICSAKNKNGTNCATKCLRGEHFCKKHIHQTK